MSALRVLGIVAVAAAITGAAPQRSGPVHFRLGPGAHVIEVALETDPLCSVLTFGGSPDITIERLLTPEGIDYTFVPGHFTPQRTSEFFRLSPLPGVSSAATIYVQNNGDATRQLTVLSRAGCYFSH